MATRLRKPLILLGLILVLGLAHGAIYEDDEPFFNNDETRHVMTGVFFRDVILDLPIGNLREYATSYYLQYPAVGLLIWPPLFHLLEGLFMVLFGVSPIVPQILIALFLALACAYLFQLVSHTHDTPAAALATLTFGFSPLTFAYSQVIMLELPALALGLAATFHFVRYLDLDRRRDLLLAALAAALAALTRFNAVYLLPFFLILIIARNQWAVLRRRSTFVAAAAALLLVLPSYALSLIEVGTVQSQLVTQAIHERQVPYLSLERLLFYPSRLPEQIGWFAVVPALVGLAGSIASPRRRRCWPYLAIAAATYLTSTLIAPMDSRYVIYWVPTFALLAAEGIGIASHALRRPGLRGPLWACVVLGTAWSAFTEPRHFVRGYEDAARFVLANSGNSRFSLFDGALNGNFIYQMRRHDPARRVWVLRGDKIFFTSLMGGPTLHYREFARSDQDFLDIIFKYDPELIVVEEPRAFSRIPAADRLRKALDSHPERFSLAAVIPVQSNDPAIRGVTLKVYKVALRNPHPENRIEIEMLYLGRTIQAVTPPNHTPRKSR